MNGLRRFHDDDVGLSTLQVILIVAIAAIILALIKFAWYPIKNWFTIAVFTLMDFEESGPPSTGGS